jgi:hypothetical protein
MASQPPRFFACLPAVCLSSFVAACLAIGVPSLQAESSLLENSPFLPPEAMARATPTTAPLELRSILKEEGQYEFSLYDPARKQSTWVRLNEPGNPFLVKAFDPANDTITVEQRSRTYTLTLKESKIIPQSSRPTPQIAGTNPGEPIADGSQPTITTGLDQRHPRAIERLRELQRQRESSPPPSGPVGQPAGREH